MPQGFGRPRASAPAGTGGVMRPPAPQRQMPTFGTQRSMNTVGASHRSSRVPTSRPGKGGMRGGFGGGRV